MVLEGHMKSRLSIPDDALQALEKAIEMESIEKDRTRSLGARQYAAEQKVYWLKVAEAIEAFGGRWTPQYYSRV
jgi:uncharacterized membrane protein